MFRDFLTVAVGWVVGIMVIGAFFLVLGAKEDEAWFNCHISGNMQCGSSAPWHGFVNF